MCLWAQCVHAMVFNDQRTTELVLSFYHVGSSDPVRVIRLCGKLLYWLKHLNSHFFFLTLFLRHSFLLYMKLLDLGRLTG